MADYTTQIEQLYVAYFDRPADVYGLAFWNNRLNTGGSISEISNQFSTSAEYLATFAGLDLYQTVTRVYQNLFNRAPDTDGLVYWVTALTNHSVTIANVVEVITNAALANPATEVDHVSIVSKVAAATAFTHALVTPDQIAAYSGTGPALVAKEWLAPIHDAATLASATTPAALSAAIAYIESVPSTTTALTAGQDNLYGTSGNDVFTSTQATLQLGDSVHGGAGHDTLSVAISGAGIALNGFATDSVETIEVKSLATSTNASTIDFSDVVGLTQVVSRETDGAPLTFQDIQSVNGVSIKIVDTLETHNFTYDTHAYTSGVDTVDLTLQEIRNATINFATTHGILGDSLVDQVNIHSVNVINQVADLNVGSNLKVINIDGNADLRIVAPLDPNLTTVDAHGLNAKLRLDLSAEALDSTVTGALGDTYLDFGSESHKKTVVTFGGNDTILAVNGLNDISTADGKDTVYSGVANDTITTGAGDDFVSDLGGNNVISTGDDNDIVQILTPRSPLTDVGNDYINLGAGNDRLIIDAHDLEVYDTILGGSGIDTIELHNTGSSDALGHVLASETQQTSSIEVFDLRDANITLALTDHLIATAQDNSLTVRTIDASGPETVDIRAITTPLYHITLDGGLNKDTVIANEQTINSFSSLHFGDGSTEDTLVIYGDANISATDTINITGLERIELKADTTEPATWSIDLTTGLLNQTTGATPLYIVVSPNTPQGSVLYINTVGLNSPVDVYVERNSNVKVYVNGTPIVASGSVSHAVYTNADPLGDLFVQTELHFTTNADSLVGSIYNDTFYADSTAQIGPADYANGNDGTDTLVLGAGLYNGGTIQDQFDNAVIKNIEILTISDNPGYAVHFADSATKSYDFNTFNLTNGDDVVDHAQSGHTFNTFEGNDIVTLDPGAVRVTVNGGGGYDEVHFTDQSIVGGTSSVYISEVEYVHGSNENNTVTILDSNTVGVHLDLFAGNDVVQGSSHADNLTVDGGTELRDGVDVVYGNGGDDTLFVQHVELVYGDRADSGDHLHINSADFVGGNDTITTTHDVLGDTPDTVIGGAGNDTITLLNSAKDTVVFGYEAEHTGSGPVAVSSGNDTIYHFAAGAINPGPTEDVLDFSGLIAHSAKFGPNDVVRGNLDWGIDLVNDGHFNIAVVWNANPTEIVDNAGTTFTTFWQPGHIAIANNGEAVIAFTSDAEGDNVENVTLAYVVDTDAGAGQTWEVTIIGTVHFDQLTGLNSSGTLNAENFHVA